MAAGGSSKAVVAALLANAGIAVAKFVGFLLTRSSSMLAEAVHSVADSGNQALLLLGGARARREPTPAHPFGYARERYFWAFVVTIVLFTLGSAFALYEGVEKLRHPHEVTSPGIAVGILVVGIALETWSFRTAIVEADKVRGDASWPEFVRHSKNPELAVVLLEDLGAEAGLFLALAGVGLVLLTGDPAWDGYATVAIGILLGIIAIVLAIEMKSLLIGESASPAVVAEIRAQIEGSAHVTALLELKTQHLGPDELLVAGKIALADGLSVAQVAQALDAAEGAVRERVPAARLIYLEPDLPATADLPPHRG